MAKGHDERGICRYLSGSRRTRALGTDAAQGFCSWAGFICPFPASVEGSRGANRRPTDRGEFGRSGKRSNGSKLASQPRYSNRRRFARGSHASSSSQVGSRRSTGIGAHVMRVRGPSPVYLMPHKPLELFEQMPCRRRGRLRVTEALRPRRSSSPGRSKALLRGAPSVRTWLDKRAAVTSLPSLVIHHWAAGR